MSLIKSLEENKVPIRGIINVGAGIGSEMDEYLSAGVTNIILMEPGMQQFKVLEDKYFTKAQIFKMAAGEFEGSGSFFTSAEDSGQYDSFLFPTDSLRKKIPFNGSTNVNTSRLDRMRFDGTQNVLCIDTCGTELSVLKGALELLNTIDAIYIRIDRVNDYQGATSVYELTNFLEKFSFVEIQGEDNEHAFFIKRNTPKYIASQPAMSVEQKTMAKYISPVVNNDFLIEDNDFVERVPPTFRPRAVNVAKNLFEIDFEAWYYENFSATDQSPHAVYLPIMWTAFFSNNTGDKRKLSTEHLQNFLNDLDKDKKYYTICNAKEGIYMDIANFPVNLKVINVGFTDVNGLMKALKENILTGL